MEKTLTQRELAVMSLADSGMTRRMIGKRLGIAESTVRSHMHSVYTKLNARNRVHALKMLREQETKP